MTEITAQAPDLDVHERCRALPISEARARVGLAAPLPAHGACAPTFLMRRELCRPFKAKRADARAVRGLLG